MKYPKILGVLLVLVVALTACSSAATPTQTTVNTLPPVSTEPLGTPSVDLTGSPSVDLTGTPFEGGTTGTPSVSEGTGTAGVPVTGANCDTATVQLASNAKMETGRGTGTGTTGTSTVGTSTPTTGDTTATGTATSGIGKAMAGDYLVDCHGMALYVNMDDTPNGGSSSCGNDDDCSTKWPPLTLADGTTPMAGDGVDESLLSTITRDDGTVQVTYNGWPLYLYSEDTATGDTNGVGEDNNWFLISPTGDPIQQQ